MPKQDITTQVCAVRSGAIAESFVSSQRLGDDPLAVFRGFPPAPGEVAVQWVFGGCTYHEEALALMDGMSWPLMWLQGDRCSGQHVAGTQALMVQGAEVRRLVWNGRTIGSCWSDADADYCWLAGILPDDVSAPRPVQARQVYENLERALGQVGMTLRDVVRTWLFLDELLDWYAEFNAVRTGFFRAAGLFEQLVPASTGIGAANPAGAAMVAGAVAIRPKHAGVTIAAVESPLQCPATNYRSSFSRAVELRFPDRRQLMISGTASIAPDGASVHRDDVPAQIDRTMEVVQAILKSRGMTWDSTVRAIAYFTDMTDVPHFTEYCAKHGIRNLPVVHAHATVCRADLLFELELDAVTGGEK